MIVFPPRDTLSLGPLASKKDSVWRVNQSFPVTLQLYGQSVTFWIEEGFETDGKTIPWWARFRFPTWGRGGLSALFHDWLLKWTDLPKWEIDMLFFHALKSEGVPDFEATIMFLAVRTRRR